MTHASAFKVGWVLLWLLGLALVTRALGAGESPATVQPAPEPYLMLRAEGELLSLQATNASLKEIVHAIGRQLDIPVTINMPDRSVTTSFQGLSVIEALKHLNVNAIYFQRAEGDNKRITKIIALRQVQSANQPPQADVKRRASSPEPFKFEFDPLRVKRKAN